MTSLTALDHIKHNRNLHADDIPNQRETVASAEKELVDAKAALAYKLKLVAEYDTAIATLEATTLN